MALKEWSLMPPPGAQLVFWQDGTLRLRFDSAKTNEIVQWAESMATAVRTIRDMEVNLAAKRAQEAVERAESEEVPSEVITPKAAVVPALAETPKPGVSTVVPQTDSLELKRKVKPMLDPPKPMMARPVVVRQVIPPSVNALGMPQGQHVVSTALERPTIQPRVQPPLPEVPPDVPKGVKLTEVPEVPPDETAPFDFSEPMQAEEPINIDNLSRSVTDEPAVDTMDKPAVDTTDSTSE